MSLGGGRRPLPGIEPPLSHSAQVSRWSMRFPEAAPPRWWILADAAPHLELSRLAFRRAANHCEHLRGLLLEHFSIVDFDVEAQQGLRIGSPDIEPPGWKAHRHAIKVVDLSTFGTIVL